MAFSIGSKPVPTNNEEDEFEKEMASELSATMDCLTTAFSKGKKDGVEAGPSRVESVKPQTKEPEENDSEFYDDVYFDSDDSDVEGEFRRNKIFRLLSFNMHILYAILVICSLELLFVFFC